MRGCTRCARVWRFADTHAALCRICRMHRKRALPVARLGAARGAQRRGVGAWRSARGVRRVEVRRVEVRRVEVRRVKAHCVEADRVEAHGMAASKPTAWKPITRKPTAWAPAAWKPPHGCPPRRSLPRGHTHSLRARRTDRTRRTLPGPASQPTIEGGPGGCGGVRSQTIHNDASPVNRDCAGLTVLQLEPYRCER
jgi:hypothetical protein